MASLYGVEAELIAVAISLFSLGISIFTLTRDKPELDLEKYKAEIVKNEHVKLVNFTYFLSNTGKQPTTIKSIELQTKDKFIPSANHIEIYTETLLCISGVYGGDEKIKSLDIPFTILPHTSKKIESQLNFNGREISESELHFNLVIKHTKGTFKKYI